MIEIILSGFRAGVGVVHLDRLTWNTVDSDNFSIEEVSALEQDILEILEDENISLTRRTMNIVLEYLLDTYPLVSFGVYYHSDGVEHRRVVHIVSGRGDSLSNQEEVPPTKEPTISRVSRYQRNPVI